MYDLLTIGDATMDTFLILDEHSSHCKLDKEKRWLSLHYADKIVIADTAQSVGGNAANVAVGAATLGLCTAIVSDLGDDINGHMIEEELKDRGVDTTFVTIKKGAETRYSVILNYKAERTILSYHAKHTYTLPALTKTKWIYFTSLGQGFEKIQKKVEDFLKKNPETKLAVNPGSYQLDKGRSTFRRLLPQTYLLFLNKEEAMRLVGKELPVPALLRQLSKAGAKLIALTDGVNGSTVFDGHTLHSLPPFPTKPLGKTGAGDAYASGFLSAIFYGKTPLEAMHWGSANASSVIRHYGAHKGLLNKKQITTSRP